MRKLLRSQDILLLGLSGAIDIFNDFKDPLGITRFSYNNFYGYIPDRFKKTNYYQTVYHSLKTGYIEKIIKNGEPYLRLTSKGKEKAQRDFSFVRWQNKKWDGKWRIVIFDIEEKQRKKRDQLRRKLKELGFGMIQESVWITPYDIAVDFREFVESIGLGSKVFVMEVGELLAGDKKDLAAKIWSLDKINFEYEELYNILKKVHDREQKSIVGKKERERIWEKYVKILLKDPCLPKELLPNDYYRGEVEKLIKKLR